MPTLGRTQLLISDAGKINVFIVERLPADMVVGSDALMAGGANLNYKDNILTWFGKQFELTQCPDHIPFATVHIKSITGDEEIDNVLFTFQDIFYNEDKTLPACNVPKCTIETGNSLPVRQRAYRTPLMKRDVVEKEVEKLLRDGIIRKSSSPYASPIVLVPKKDGSLRFTIDYRKLNAVTIKDSHPLPLIQDIFDQLHGAQYFSTLDLKTAYWQVPMAKSDIKKTAFICHAGLFEFVRMPMGLKNAGAFLQRAMESILHGLVGKICLVFLDDVVIYSNSRENHLKNLKTVLDRFKKHRLTIKPSKCEFLKTEISLLGFIVSKDGIKANPSKVSAIKNMLPPTKVNEVRSFLGGVNYYRNLIKNYATMAKPLFDLTKKNAKFVWSDICQQSFDNIKSALISEPILTYPDMSKPFKLFTDASDYAVGSILVQESSSGEQNVVQYVSHSLDPVQQRWPTIEKECYAIVYSLQKLRPYLWGAEFEIFTDHKPLKALFAQQIANSKIQRWAVQIAEFGAKINYTKGIDNTRADMLSRAHYPLSPEKKPLDINVIEMSLPIEFDDIDRDELITLQREEFPDLIRRAEEEESYIIKDGILLSLIRPMIEHAVYPRIVLPVKYRENVIMHRHEQIGHAALRRTLFHVQEAYVWPGMCRTIKNTLAKCPSCQVFQEKRPHVHLGKMPMPVYPHQIVSVDIVGPLPRTKSRHTYLLTIVDHLTAWADAYPITHKTGSTVADCLMKYYFPQYGYPEILITDNGKEFINSDVQNLLKHLDIKHNRTTAYHPQGNAKA